MNAPTIRFRPDQDAIPGRPADDNAGAVRLLVVDDDDAVRKCVARIVKSMGFAAVTAGGTDEALRLLADGGFDVALVDLDMPERTGLDLLASLRAVGADVVPVLLTGTTDVAAAVGAMKMGAYDYLAKPVDPAALARVIARAVDVSHARRRELALRRVVAEWESTFDACPDLLVVIDPSGLILRANETAVSLATAGDLTGLSIEEVFPGGLGAAAAEHWRRQRAGEPAASSRLLDEALSKHFLITVTPLRAPSGPCPGAVVVARDVTDLVRVKDILRTRDAHTRAILATAADTIVTYCDGYRVESLNPAGATAFGCSASDAVGLDVRRLVDFPPGDGRPGGPGRWVSVGRRADGSTFPVEIAVGEVVLAGGRKFVGVVRDLTEWKRGEEVRARLLRQVLTAQEDERRRISRDLHDGIGQALVSLSIGLGTATSAAAAGPEADQLQRLGRVAADSLEDVRRLAQGLRPTVLDDLGLVAALGRLVELFNQVHGVRAQFILSSPPASRLPTEVESVAYRIAQEALANVAKHSGAQTVDVVLEASDGVVRLSVSDDGIGFDPSARGGASRGLGLSGMCERATLLGGAFRVDAGPGRGTIIDVRIPSTGVTP